MRLHVLTAVTRPENLPALAQSLEGAAELDIEVCWHTRADPERQAVGGQALKNAMLEDDDDPEGWVWILDDDNVCHPMFFPSLRATLAAHPLARLIAIAQQHQGRYVRQVNRGMLRQTHVDAGQVVIRKDAIGDRRIPLHYCGDGEWIEDIANGLADDQIAYVRTPATYYNWLRSHP
jgi:hypothetical protein